MRQRIGAGFLASGAAATDAVVADAATPFDRRRHGMIVGMGAAALVIEGDSAARERGLRPICEVVSTITANSAFHGTRLDVEHITAVMERLLRQAEQRGPVDIALPGCRAHRHHRAQRRAVLDHFLGAPDLLPHPGEIEKLHVGVPPLGARAWARPARR